MKGKFVMTMLEILCGLSVCAIFGIGFIGVIWHGVDLLFYFFGG